MKTFSKELSKAFKDIGIEVESDFYHYYTNTELPNGTRWEVRHKTQRISEYDAENSHDDDIAPAYRLEQIPSLLKELGRVKGWGEEDGLLGEWYEYWIGICSLYVKTGELQGECEEYLMKIL